MGKSPIEFGWNRKASYVYADPKLINHLQQGKNYGLACGRGGLIILDWDDISTIPEVEKIIPKTFTVQTGGGKRHYYFTVSAGTPKIVFIKDGIHYGELQSTGSQCVGPNSFYPVGKKRYDILKDVDIVELPQEIINKLRVLYTDEIDNEPIKVVNWDMYKKSSIDFSISSLTHKLGNLKRRGNELYGTHPVHGSKTGMNFFANTSKNIWHCFRCNSGGDSLSLLSMLEGVCDCKDFSSGGKKLRGEDFKKVLDIAKRDYGLVIENRNLVELEKQHLDIYKNKEVQIITDFELDSMDFEPIEWIVEHLIPNNSIILLAGKTRTKKSFVITYIALCICYKLKLLDKFEVFLDSNCLYLDEENPNFLTKNRNRILRKGLGVGPTKKLGYVINSGIKLDSSEGLGKLIELIKTFKPKLVILDSLVRFISKGTTDENKSTDMSNILTNLRRITSEHNVSFVLIHHLNKTLKQNDEADSVRGSSDITNAVDCALLFNLSGDSIKVRQIKNRYEPEIKPFTISDIQEVNNEGKITSLKFQLASGEVEKMDAESRTAVSIYEYFSREKNYNTPEKIIRTKEAIDRFSSGLSTSQAKARQIINESLNKLIKDGKIERIRQGFFKVLGVDEERLTVLSDFSGNESNEDNEEETEE